MKIVKYINSKTFIHNIHIDGRVGSIKDEEDCINLLKQSDDFIVLDENDKIVKDKICIIVPKIREWYDIEVLYNNRHYYINIKSSTLKTYDNVGCVAVLMFGLFGKRKILSNKTKSEQYAELFFEYNKHDKNGYDDVSNIDYYFLVINKNKSNGCFITSLNHMNKKSIQSNGSNLPFQCNWGRNSSKILLDKSKICDMIIRTVFESLVKSIDIFEQEPIKIYMSNHNINRNIPNISSLW